jgi:hypothetical protein
MEKSKAATKTPQMAQPQAQEFPAGSYVNFLRVAHGNSEVYLAFGQASPGQTPTARLVSSLVTTPVHAKAMLKALAATIERYEEQFGEIQAPEPHSSGNGNGKGNGS